MTSSTSEKAIRLRNKQISKDRETDKTVIQALMKTVDGRRWVWLRLSNGRMFVEDEGLDPYRMAYDKGLRNEALRLLKSVTSFTPDLYITMTRENTGVEIKDHSNGRPDYYFDGTDDGAEPEPDSGS